MFEINRMEDGRISIVGRLDAAHAPDAQAFLDAIDGRCEVDLGRLEYISSAGLGVLLKTHKRLMSGGEGLILVNVGSHINDIFKYSGFDKLFEIRLAAD